MNHAFLNTMMIMLVLCKRRTICIEVTQFDLIRVGIASYVPSNALVHASDIFSRILDHQRSITQ